MKGKVQGTIFLLSLVLLSFAQKKPEAGFRGDYLEQPRPGKTPELFAPGMVSTGNHELDIAISPDLNEIYFTRAGQDWFSAVVCYRRVAGVWREPEVPRFVNEHGANYPFVTPDGTKIFFETKDAVPGEGEAEEMVALAERTPSGWSTLKAVHLNRGDFRMMFVSVSRRGTLYFSSNRQGGLGGFDIFKSDIAPDGSLNPENLGPAVNSQANDFHAFIAPDESYLIFDSQNRPGGYGRNDLYISFRKGDGTWTPAENLGADINTEAGEMRPFVSPDGKWLFFCSDRPLARPRSGGPELDYRRFMERINGPGNANQDIYWMDAGIIEKAKQRVLGGN